MEWQAEIELSSSCGTLNRISNQAAQTSGATAIAGGMGKPSLTSQINDSANDMQNVEVDETDGEMELPDISTASLESQNMSLIEDLEQYLHWLDQQVFSEHSRLTNLEKALQLRETLTFDQQAFQQFTTTSHTFPNTGDLRGTSICASNVLKAHEKTHSGAKDYKCHICQTMFTTNGSLKRHSLIHNSGRTHAEALEENAMDETDKENHKVKSNFIQLSDEQTLKLAKQPPEKCSTISKKILIASAAEKDRVCEIKNKEVEFTKQPKSPHMCHVCPKSFKNSSALVRHTRIHTGEKPYTCPVCNRSFSEKTNLRKHLRTHTGEKPFNCQVCGARFATKNGLKVHMALHTGEKKYKCPYCEECFRTASHERKSHIATKHMYKNRLLIPQPGHSSKASSSSLDQEYKPHEGIIIINDVLPNLQLDDAGMTGGVSTAGAEMPGDASSNLIHQSLNFTFPFKTQLQMLVPIEQSNRETTYQLTFDQLSDGDLTKENTEVLLHITESGEV